ncbi:MAG: hypothetical protein A2339_01440 [Elusimicrobia bacterium RIFOXYB12_FULL_50_12]|nr:MAG: hypothetical protein A2278_00740 [Elusimicrobia bacterium RIFOXYA12_FULL_49_49]OGS15183.1 MAG: hypothetical protein A2251_00750 [Elusimicrobia bacterium RIFOXYA2_FULL_47_53]OGS26947.1 MAG: hypothetical protein A2339_01440 [Elusimicrobia bacterium RIFOXYB12_FULL_50_12]OGS29803.1 MAG: hypothetical protein A2323_01550 [Elusimicrobia bacterium RIFOXYB2_FULL_46_23]
MKILFLALLSLTMASSAAFALQGKLILKSGHSFKGDITKYSDGSYLVCGRSGAVKFEKSEISRVIVYSSKDPLSESFASSLKVTPGARPAASSSATPYDNTIHKAAKKNNIDPALVKAIIKAESNFNPLDRSAKGACGLMQLMPQTARLLGVKNIYSPEENILAGTRFFKDMLFRFNGNVDKALAAYNAGPGAVDRYNSIPPYKETKNYIKTVNKNFIKYKNRDGRICSYTDANGCTTIYNVK